MVNEGEEGGVEYGACPRCGGALAPAKPGSTKVVCQSCGYGWWPKELEMLRAASGGGSAPGVPVSYSENPSAIESIAPRFCPSCGAPTAGLSFCGQCGLPVSGQSIGANMPRAATETMVRVYKGSDEYQKDAKRLAKDGWSPINTVERRPRAGCLRIILLWWLTLLRPPRPELVVTYQRIR